MNNNNPERIQAEPTTNDLRHKTLESYKAVLDATLLPQGRNSETLARDRNVARLKEIIKTDPKNMRFYFLDVNQQIKEFVGNEARQGEGPTQVADSMLLAWINFEDLEVEMWQEAAAARSVLGGVEYSDAPKFVIDYNGALFLMYAGAKYPVDMAKLPKNEYTDKLKLICNMQAESKVLAPLKYGRRLQGKYEIPK